MHGLLSGAYLIFSYKLRLFCMTTKYSLQNSDFVVEMTVVCDTIIVNYA